MTFADLVANLDAAVAPILVVLDKAGPQWMAGPNNTVQTFRRDASPLGLNVEVAQQASATIITVPGATAMSPVAQQLAAAKALIEASGAEAAKGP